ncbi:MAG: peptidoglycan DD-metalloendopeptidase family protein [Hydrogenophaga sp.]
MNHCAQFLPQDLPMTGRQWTPPCHPRTALESSRGGRRPGLAAWQRAGLLVLTVGLVLTAGCSTRRVAQPAPVEDRAGAAAPEAGKALPGAENAGKPGYYTVKPGDTLYRIALEHGQAPRDLQTWNNMANPNLIEVGQVLRVAPPASVATAPVAAPLPGSAVVGRPLGQAGVAAPPASAANGAAPAAPATASVPESAGADEVAFVWPAQGSVIASFDEARNKGVSIAGKLGDPVLAAADGRVVYAGAGLRGYGNLIILKHNNTFLTAYAHNQALLVREDQQVRQGQRIAEMGSSDTDRVKLHFEVRRQGKPVDPLNYLPRR